MFYLLFFFMRYNFNTSHVTVYLHGNGRMEYRTKFQYISCYGLSPAAGGTSGHLSAISIHLMLRFIFQSLTAYPVSQEFQYISCYGLSFCNFTQFFRHVLFQYISCYGLSPCCIGKNQLKYISIHLMLRFICVCDRARVHVIQISIHLMLRFIIKKCL